MDRFEDRRSILRLTGIGLATGLAGCAGNDGSGTEDSSEDTPTGTEQSRSGVTDTPTDGMQRCEAPSGSPSYSSLEPILPGGERYDQGNPQGLSAVESLPFQGGINIGYESPNGVHKLFVGKYDSRSAAQNDGERRATRLLDDQYDLVVSGYLAVENWLFAASGESAQRITTFLATSETLGQECLSNRLTFVDSS